MENHSKATSDYVTIAFSAEETCLLLICCDLEDRHAGVIEEARRNEPVHILATDLEDISNSVNMRALRVADSRLAIRLNHLRDRIDAILNAHDIGMASDAAHPAPVLRRSQKPPKSNPTVYQLKISIPGLQPAIWRRIQIENCTLDRLHLLLQAAIGWENRYSYHFNVSGKEYCSTTDCDDPFSVESVYTTHLSKVVPHGKKQFPFYYNYNILSLWIHQVVFEGRHRAQAGVRYPLCIGGARAWPPEGVCGNVGYRNLLKWVSASPESRRAVCQLFGRFDPESFDAELATKRMRRVPAK